MVELLREVAGQLEVLLLIFTHRHQVGVIKQDIRGHQDRVEKQAGVDRLLLAGLVLELGHPLQLSQGAKATEDPGQFGMPDDMGLHEEPAPGRVEPAGHVLGEARISVIPELGRDGGDRDGVLVNDAEVAIVVVLHPAPVKDRPEVITQMQAACRLGAGQDHELGGLFFGRIAHSGPPSVAGGRPGIKRIGRRVTLEIGTAPAYIGQHLSFPAMFFAQAAPTASTTLKTTVAQEANVIFTALGWVASAIIVGWATKKLLGWIATKFDQSPIVKATVTAVGKSLQILIPAYTVFWFNHLNPGLIPDTYDKGASIAIDLLLSLAHTTTVFHLVAVPIAWGQKLADETENKLDDVLVPMISTVIKLTVVLVGGVKAISIVDADTSKSILGLLAAGVSVSRLPRRTP